MAAAPRQADGRVRLIGGQWRRRVLRFDTALGVRPTPDRVRETLFNWLQPVIEGANCLDLFAGTGALGLEALSRGADRVSFVDRNVAVLNAIRGHGEMLGAGTRLAPVCADAQAYLRSSDSRFDVIFVDPPYALKLLPALLPALERRLLAGGYVYMEADSADEILLPPGWTWFRQARAGRVSYGLAERESAVTDDQ